jgi:hypothetical protein
LPFQSIQLFHRAFKPTSSGIRLLPVRLRHVISETIRPDDPVLGLAEAKRDT